MGIPIIGASKPDEKEIEHVISFRFADDHTVDGAKVDVLNVTPEQIAVAIIHLQRIAFMSMAQRDAVAMAAERQAIQVRQGLANERKGN